MIITLPQIPQVLAHWLGISPQYDLVHPRSLSSHSESIVKSFQVPKIISELGEAPEFFDTGWNNLFIYGKKITLWRG